MMPWELVPKFSDIIALSGGDVSEQRRLFESRLHRVWWYENGRR